MARLSDYGINIKDLSNVTNVTIQGRQFPVAFTMETMEYIADVYGGDYAKFENDMNSMLRRKENQLTMHNLTPSDLKIMRSLIYGMLRSGGLEESPEAITQFLGMGNDVLAVYGVCMEIFSNQTFQVQDLKKSVKPQDFQKTNQNRKNKNKRRNPKKN